MNTLNQAELKTLARLEGPGIVLFYVPRHQPRSADAIGPIPGGLVVAAVYRYPRAAVQLTKLA